MGTEEKVLSTLKSAGNAMKSAEIAEASGLNKKDVDKAVKKLKEQGKIILPKNCFYQAK